MNATDDIQTQKKTFEIRGGDGNMGTSRIILVKAFDAPSALEEYVKEMSGFTLDEYCAKTPDYTQEGDDENYTLWQMSGCGENECDYSEDILEAHLIQD